MPFTLAGRGHVRNYSLCVRELFCGVGEHVCGCAGTSRDVVATLASCGGEQ